MTTPFTKIKKWIRRKIALYIYPGIKILASNDLIKAHTADISEYVDKLRKELNGTPD